MEERRSFLDKLHNDKVDLDKTISLCIRILDQYWRNYNNAYLESDYSIYGLNFHEAYNSVVKEKICIDGFLDFCDLVITVLLNYKGSSFKIETTQVIKILLNALNILGYGIKKQGHNCIKCYMLDLKSEIIASTQSKTIEQKIYKYLSLHDGDVEEKRKTLKDIIDEIDTYCKNRTSVEILTKTKHFYQCVRHPLDDPVREYSFYYKNEEKWLDYIFQMVVDVLAHRDLEERVKEIKKKEKECNEVKK